jgi:hypothetical protein
MEIHLTVDELVALLKRSSLTTIIVEGKDDMMIYRWIEEQIGITTANFLACGGRDKLLQIYKRREEFSHIRTIFVADKDAFVYTNVPPEYSEIVWTEGYSIENDLYRGKEIEKLFTGSEEANFRIALRNFTTYYAFEVESLHRKLVYSFSNHPNQVLNDQHELNPDFLEAVGFTEPEENTINYLLDEYDLLIRGKSLFALLLRFLCHTRRDIKHSKKTLIETCYRMTENRSVNGLVDRIKEKLCA